MHVPVPPRLSITASRGGHFIYSFLIPQPETIVWCIVIYMVSSKDMVIFQKTVRAFYTKQGRFSLPWRKTKDPYRILVSELMLQQTQVGRVVVKYEEFLKRFPTMESLARSPLSDVLRAWQGLGYNRRAKFLHLLAKEVVKDYKGKLPSSEEKLLQLPGIGRATASALMAFAFNRPTVYLETNVRSVFLHHFFPDADGVSDSELLPLIERAAVGQPSREWNWALLDYGSYIKTTHGNPNARSKHYAKQSKFVGSNRQVRGAVLRALEKSAMGKVYLMAQLQFDRVKTEKVLRDLLSEGLISKRGAIFHLGS